MDHLTVLNTEQLTNARLRYLEFIDICKDANDNFRLTPRADASAYALCFAIYGYWLVQAKDVIDTNRVVWNRILRDALVAHQEQRSRITILCKDKSYLQLLTFTLSALSILRTLDVDPLDAAVLAVLPKDIETALIDAGTLKGVVRSGNHAMFLAVLLLHADKYLGRDSKADLDLWVALHRDSMNRFGFWGHSHSMSHLQFQNGYHQYELLEYLQSKNIPWRRAAGAVASLADVEGHFAPYPGGGGCYDYDAVFILTATQESIKTHYDLLTRTAKSILKEQNTDGGFCESKLVRPRSLPNLIKSLDHVSKGRGTARLERLRHAVTLLRPKHDRVHTHWSDYSREWGESDLWDSWFRMLTLARIDSAFNPEHSKSWGFINFPGIGFHPSLRGDC